ncbi:hypothetical protein ARMGADRAFT_1059783 [Armillaria gallica]|uniref:Uncharacterized protein n=1 Tax=Armillaria gallica TaxID=47427 RepID=A0A2H3E0P8_ARMGA|nr:hypothetical protein ARMGADRAFT_1059783 [Armillaria gallica]
MSLGYDNAWLSYPFVQRYYDLAEFGDRIFTSNNKNKLCVGRATTDVCANNARHRVDVSSNQNMRMVLSNDSAHESVVESPLQCPNCDYIHNHCLFVRHKIAYAGGPGTSIPGLYYCVPTVGDRRSSRIRPAYILIAFLPYYRSYGRFEDRIRPSNLDDECMLTDLSPSITGLSNAFMRLTPAFKG